MNLGKNGLQYSPLLDSQPEKARSALLSKLASFESTSLKGHLSAWRRWARFVHAAQPADAEPIAPTLEGVFVFCNPMP